MNFVEKIANDLIYQSDKEMRRICESRPPDAEMNPLFGFLWVLDEKNYIYKRNANEYPMHMYKVGPSKYRISCVPSEFHPPFQVENVIKFLDDALMTYAIEKVMKESK